MANLQRFARNLGNWLFPVRILSTANSFEDGGLWTVPALNRLGLHRWRVKTAAKWTRRRRAKLADQVPYEWREEFAENGFVIIRNVMPKREFDAMKKGLLSHRWPTRHMTQGDTITRRVAVDDAMLETVPELKAVLERDDLQSLFRYVASFDAQPLFYLQAIIRRRMKKLPEDPQVHPHADTFHSSMKAWLFLEDVEPGQGAFSYVPGSHRLTDARLKWEHETAIAIDADGDRMTRRGSFRASNAELGRMGLPRPREISCPANTLVVADTFGFHARGASTPDLHRLEVWAYSRRNPFKPWIGGDLLGGSRLAGRRVEWLWKIRDHFPGLFKQPWEPVGDRYLDSGPTRKHVEPGKKKKLRRGPAKKKSAAKS